MAPQKLDLNATKDIIGVVQTPIKDVWRVLRSLTGCIQQLCAAEPPLILPPKVMGSGVPFGTQEKQIYEALNEASEDSSGYVRPTKSVSQLTPTFVVIPNPQVICVDYVVPCGTASIPVTVNIHFGCDRDFTSKIPGSKLVVTWETKNHKYGLIEHHVTTISPSLGALVAALASDLDGIGYLSLDSGIARMGRTQQY